MYAYITTTAAAESSSQDIFFLQIWQFLLRVLRMKFYDTKAPLNDKMKFLWLPRASYHSMEHDFALIKLALEWYKFK